ncbi:pilus assembly protein [Arsenicicoccus dermatophilus]|uniref:pilus assembly protein n=1 Tax=Arsenicicoccus dermatophilus TaxID=1076331 RepID=UPI001F4C8822|nr:pilus assembly protein [Arsenicicoccus dermatophilus]
MTVVRERLRRQDARRQESERGSASLELVGVSLVLLVPLVYLVMTLSRLQAGAYAVSGTARDAGRIFAAAQDEAVAHGRAATAARIIFRDYGFAAGDVQVTCLDDPCLSPDARVRATTSLRVPLPLVPDLVRAVVPTEITVRGEHLDTVDRFRGEAR